MLILFQTYRNHLVPGSTPHFVCLVPLLNRTHFTLSPTLLHCAKNNLNLCIKTESLERIQNGHNGCICYTAVTGSHLYCTVSTCYLLPLSSKLWTTVVCLFQSFSTTLGPTNNIKHCYFFQSLTKNVFCLIFR